MSLRGLLVFVAVLGSLPLTLVHPFVGIITWNWLAYLNPHQQTWGALEGYRLAYVVALATIAGMLLSGKDRFRGIRSRPLFWAGGFFVTLVVATTAAGDRAASQEKLVQYAKIFLMCYVMICVVRSERRFRILTWTTAIFISLIGMKGVVLAPMRGFPMIYGPPKSFITDNNDYALAMNMMLPFFWALGTTERDRRLKFFWYLCLGLTAAAVLFTYSRGGFIGLGITTALMVWKSRHKVAAVALLGAAVLVGTTLAPQRLEERIRSLRQVEEIKIEETAEEHAGQFSAQDRIRAWRVAWRMAEDNPLTGVGLRNFKANYYRYADQDVPDYAKVAHSAYFHVLGEAGFPALFFFVAVIASSLFTAYRLRRRLRRITPGEAEGMQRELGLAPGEGRPRAGPAPRVLDRFRRYALMCEISLMSYTVTAAFLSRADFDLYFQVVAMTVMLEQMVRRGVARSLEPEAGAQSREEEVSGQEAGRGAAAAPVS